MFDMILLTRAEIVQALDDTTCRHVSPVDAIELKRMNRSLVDFNFAILGNPEKVTPEQWNEANDPPYELCTIH